MTYPESFENKLGFDKIRQILKNNCLGESAKYLVDEIKFSTDISFLNKQLEETFEMLNINRLKNNFQISSYPDISESIYKLKVEGTFLTIENFIEIRQVLEISKSIISFFIKENKNDYPNLFNLINVIKFPSFVIDRINFIFSKNGTIKDNASPRLKEIRSLISEYETQISLKLNNILTYIKNQGWINKDLSVTYVNGRLVLPIESIHKRKIKGLIHDESATGKTSYIEPQEIVEINNNIRELELEENREVIKILTELTNDIKNYREELNLVFKYLSYIDFTRAKALFAHETESILPKLSEIPGLELDNAKHPLLLLTLKKENKEVVPITFHLNQNNRIMMLSGPNAGGKSVCLKTAGLLSYMVQCGLLVPVGGTSVFGIFNKIFIDIGDQQSIENDLSTYSSHLNNMKFFLKNADEKTLILIDEFGSGTDPFIGGIIAESILEELNKKNIFGVITTHYTNLKIFASNTPGIFNAAMLINNISMQPSFILQTGIPGSSYAIEIAQRSGIPQTIIERTKQIAGNTQTNIDRFLRRIARDKKYWEEKRKKIRIKEKELENHIEKNLKELEEIKQKRKKILEDAKKEADELLKNVNKKIENTIRQIKEAQANKDKTKEARQELNEFIKNFNEQINNIPNDELDRKHDFLKSKLEKLKPIKQTHDIINIDKNKINIGSKVKIKGKDLFGEVIEYNEKTAIIAFGNMYTSVAINELEKINNEDYKEIKKNTALSKTLFSQKILEFNPFIDVRGNTVEEAVKKVTNFIDEAAMLDFKEVKILHGKGNGILRQHIRDFLKTFPHVESCYDEDIRFGGSGITIVKLK